MKIQNSIFFLNSALLQTNLPYKNYQNNLLEDVFNILNSQYNFMSII